MARKPTDDDDDDDYGDPEGAQGMAPGIDHVTLFTGKPAAAAAFYGAAFGWKFKKAGAGTFMATPRSGPSLTIMKRTSEDQPRGWLPYVTVADVQPVLESAKRLGLRQVGETEADEGNVFAGIEGDALGRTGLLQPGDE